MRKDARAHLNLLAAQVSRDRRRAEFSMLRALAALKAEGVAGDGATHFAAENVALRERVRTFEHG
jgi:hypothetical protein